MAALAPQIADRGHPRARRPVSATGRPRVGRYKARTTVGRCFSKLKQFAPPRPGVTSGTHLPGHPDVASIRDWRLTHHSQRDMP